MNVIAHTSIFLLIIFATFPVCAEEPVSSLEKEMWDELFDPPFKEPAEVKKGNKLRKLLFEELRPSISKEAKKIVKFSGNIRVYKNWAFFVGASYDEKGELVIYPPMDNSDTCALWLRTRRGWTLVDYSVGHSDVFWQVWHYKYGAPNKVLGFE